LQATSFSSFIDPCIMHNRLMQPMNHHVLNRNSVLSLQLGFDVSAAM